MRKVGIFCDNYKVALFEEALKEGEFEYTIGNGITSDTKNIIVRCHPFDMQKVADICYKIENDLLNKKKKFN